MSPKRGAEPSPNPKVSPKKRFTTAQQNYVNNSQVAFRSDRVQFLALSTDGTRLGGRERLLTAFCLPETGVCYWSAPRAGTLAVQVFAVFQARKQQKTETEVDPPISADKRR